MSLIGELKRRNVIRVATAYIVVAWLVIQVVETIFPAFGFSDSAVRIVVIVFSIGFLPALIAAWIFEFTPDGLKLEKDTDRTSATVKYSTPFLDRLIIVVLLFGVSFFAIDKFLLAPERQAARENEIFEQAKSDAIVSYYGDRSIAVLPFVNMSSDPEQEFFGEGIAEEVLNLLASIRELRVISRSSAFSLKGQNLEIPEIAKRLDVAHVLEGSVRKSGNRIRVTAQLIEARSDLHLWSQTYDRDLEDIFAIQDEIAADVARNLQLVLLEPMPKSRVTDPEAYALTVQANQIWQSQASDSASRMEPLVDRALSIDPDYIPALTLRAITDFMLGSDGVIPEEEANRRWDEIAARIRKLDADNAYVMMGDAYTQAYDQGDYEGAAKLFEKAVNSGTPHSEVIRVAGAFARFIGRVDLAIELGRYSVAMDPLCLKCLYQLSRSYMVARRYEEALETRERYLALGEQGNYYFGLMKIYTGKASSALEIANKFQPDNQPQRLALLAIANFELGNMEASDAAIDKLLPQRGPYLAETQAEACAATGRADLAFKYLETLALQNSAFMHTTASNESFDSLRDDPRWEPLMARFGVSSARFEAIEFNPVLPE